MIPLSIQVACRTNPEIRCRCSGRRLRDSTTHHSSIGVLSSSLEPRLGDRTRHQNVILQSLAGEVLESEASRGQSEVHAGQEDDGRAGSPLESAGIEA